MCQLSHGHSKTQFFCSIPWLHSPMYHQDLPDKPIDELKCFDNIYFHC